MMPPGTSAAVRDDVADRGGSAPAVAICSAAEPESPCAQTLPRPSSWPRASAR